MPSFIPCDMARVPDDYEWKGGHLIGVGTRGTVGSRRCVCRASPPKLRVEYFVLARMERPSKQVYHRCGCARPRANSPRPSDPADELKADAG